MQKLSNFYWAFYFYTKESQKHFLGALKGVKKMFDFIVKKIWGTSVQNWKVDAKTHLVLSSNQGTKIRTKFSHNIYLCHFLLSK